MTDRANTSLTFSASWRTSTSGVSMEPMAPGVGMGIMLEMACRIVSTTHHPPLKSPLVQDGDHSSLWKDVMVRQIFLFTSKRPLSYASPTPCIPTVKKEISGGDIGKSEGRRIFP